MAMWHILTEGLVERAILGMRVGRWTSIPEFARELNREVYETVEEGRCPFCGAVFKGKGSVWKHLGSSRKCKPRLQATVVETLRLYEEYRSKVVKCSSKNGNPPMFSIMLDGFMACATNLTSLMSFVALYERGEL